MMRRTLAFIVALLLPLLPGGNSLAQKTQTARPADQTYTPPQGTPERKALLDAVRKKLDIKSQFSVDHLKINDGWAYFRGTEVFFDGGERQETDLSVAVLLERRKVNGKAAWTVAEMWTLPAEGEQSFKEFTARVRRRQQAAKIPADIFPAEL